MNLYPLIRRLKGLPEPYPLILNDGYGDGAFHNEENGAGHGTAQGNGAGYGRMFGYSDGGGDYKPYHDVN